MRCRAPLPPKTTTKATKRRVPRTKSRPPCKRRAHRRILAKTALRRLFEPRSPFPTATPSSSKNATLSVGRFASCQGLKSTVKTSGDSEWRHSMTIFLIEDFPLPQAPYSARTRLSRPDHSRIARASASENPRRSSMSSSRLPIGLSGESHSEGCGFSF
jgi:hypothetical protein